MKINLAKSAGFCFGVKRAIDIALKTASKNTRIYMLGDIVHNEDVVKQITQAGIKKINRLSAGQGKTLLIRAHGAAIETIAKAKKLKFTIVDATCPMVKEIHKIAKDAENKGYAIIIIGDKKHDEVLGIIGQLNSKPIIIDSIENMPFNKLEKQRKYAVVVQSTQNIEKVLKIVSQLKTRVKKLKFFNTICRPTRIKQEEIKSLPKENGVIIVIGSKASANTKRLYEISKSINKNTHWIASAKELTKMWFKDALNVGITAGASTPDSITQEVIGRIKKLTCRD
ncbi:MAG: 4-hydroxy-3-methylbut-2-enyl diphosphate reductase [Candidatus Omnitrophota bacterium]